MRRLISLIAIGSALVLATNVVVLARGQNEIRTTGDEKVVPNAMVQATIRFTPGMIKVANGEVVTWTYDDASGPAHAQSSRSSQGRRWARSSDAALPASHVQRPLPRTLSSARSSTWVLQGSTSPATRCSSLPSRHEVDLSDGDRTRRDDVAVPVRDPSLDAGQDRRRVATSRRRRPGVDGPGPQPDRLWRRVDLPAKLQASEITPAMVVDASIAPARGVSGVDGARIGLIAAVVLLLAVTIAFGGHRLGHHPTTPRSISATGQLHGLAVRATPARHLRNR